MVLDDGGMFFSEPCGEPIPITKAWQEQNDSGGGVHITCQDIILESILSKLKHLYPT